MDNAFTMDYACEKLKEDQKAFNPEIEYISNKVKEAERHKETSCEPSYDGTTLLGHLDVPPCNTPDAGKTLADEVASVLNAIGGYRVIAGGMSPELDNVLKLLEHALARYQSSFSKQSGNPPGGLAVM